MTAFKCFLELVHKEMYLFKKEFLSRLVDLAVILSTSVIVFGYLMANSGLKSNFGEFILVGAIASFGLFETIWRATCLAQDISDKKITNLLVLPLSSFYILAAIAVSWSLSTALLALCLFPLGKLLLWNQFNFARVDLGKFGLIFLTGNLFYGFFALWVASLVTNLRRTSWLWARIINPLYMFCGFFYTWKSAYQLAPWVGYLHFFNPLLYVMEGTKAAILGPEGYLPFWACLGSLALFTGLFAFDGIRRLKKRLDCV
ncbi:MAG: ABC transporter permease [Parachlamydiales bacterium]|jgi:ABC-2 type transport system permease protein